MDSAQNLQVIVKAAGLPSVRQHPLAIMIQREFGDNLCYSFDLLNKRVKNVDENGMELSENSYSFSIDLYLF